MDKKWPIRHQAIMNVARLYKNLNSKKDLTKMKEIAWMPNKVLHTYYQNTSQVSVWKLHVSNQWNSACQMWNSADSWPVLAAESVPE